MMTPSLSDLVESKLSVSQAERNHSEGMRTSIEIGLSSRLRLHFGNLVFSHWIISDEVINKRNRNDRNILSFPTPIFEGRKRAYESKSHSVASETIVL